MEFPFIVYSQVVKHSPLFHSLKGGPYILDLSLSSPLLDETSSIDQKHLQSVIEEQMGNRYHWGLAAYLERRDTLLAKFPQMVAEQRFFHLGLDIIVPVGTTLCTPLDAEVVEVGYESGDGNFGGFVLLKHGLADGEPFYSLLGHLDRDRLPALATTLSAGEAFAFVGDFHTNGNWFHHTHLQVHP